MVTSITVDTRPFHYTELGEQPIHRRATGQAPPGVNFKKVGYKGVLLAAVFAAILAVALTV